MKPWNQHWFDSGLVVSYNGMFTRAATRAASQLVNINLIQEVNNTFQYCNLGQNINRNRYICYLLDTQKAFDTLNIIQYKLFIPDI